MLHKTAMNYQLEAAIHPVRGSSGRIGRVLRPFKSLDVCSESSPVLKLPYLQGRNYFESCGDGGILPPVR